MMSNIHIEHVPSQEKLKQLGLSDWPIWSCEVSSFPWAYEETETCYILEGEVTVTPITAHRQPSAQVILSPSPPACPAPGR